MYQYYLYYFYQLNNQEITMKFKAGAHYIDNTSFVNEVSLYSGAMVEYSSLIMLSLLERGNRTLKAGARTVTFPVVKGSKAAMDGVYKLTKPLSFFGGTAKKIFNPIGWTDRQISEARRKILEIGNRGFPVHLDDKAIDSVIESLQRIEQRLANIEEKGIAVASSGGPIAGPVNADDFKEKPTKEKNMLLRSIFEDSRQIKKGE